MDVFERDKGGRLVIEGEGVFQDQEVCKFV